MIIGKSVTECTRLSSLRGMEKDWYVQSYLLTSNNSTNDPVLDRQSTQSFGVIFGILFMNHWIIEQNKMTKK